MNKQIYSALQQAYLALEELQGPGFLIGGVMHRRIGLLLPKLKEAMEEELNLDSKSVQKRLAAQIPDPKIQTLIGSNARKSIELALVDQLLEEGPDTETTALDMEYWNSTHDKLREALLDARRYRYLRDPKICWLEAGIVEQYYEEFTRKSGVDLDNLIDSK